MKIGVCVKITPDTGTRITIANGGQGIDPSGIKWIVSPYDQFAIEEAVQTAESQGGEVTLFSVGPADWHSQLRGSGLAVGAHRAVVVTDPALDDTDNLGVAKTLAAAIAAEGVQLVFCGKQAADDDAGQVPAMIAERLGWAQVTQVTAFGLEGQTLTADRQLGGGVVQTVTGPLPAVISCERGLNTPRYAKLPQIMKAKRKPLETKTLADLGLTPSDVLPAAQTSHYQPPPARTAGRIIEGDTVDAKVAELVRLLREEAKVL